MEIVVAPLTTQVRFVLLPAVISLALAEKLVINGAVVVVVELELAPTELPQAESRRDTAVINIKHVIPTISCVPR